MEYFTNVNHRKILLKEQEALEIEYVCLVVKIKMKLMKELKIKILILKENSKNVKILNNEKIIPYSDFSVNIL